MMVSHWLNEMMMGWLIHQVYSLLNDDPWHFKSFSCTIFLLPYNLKPSSISVSLDNKLHPSTFLSFLFHFVFSFSTSPHPFCYFFFFFCFIFSPLIWFKNMTVFFTGFLFCVSFITIPCKMCVCVCFSCSFKTLESAQWGYPSLPGTSSCG